MQDQLKRNLTIYGLVPSDLLSLKEPDGKGSGKCAAHALHAGNQILKYIKHDTVKQYIADGIEAGADYFSTCITLDAHSKQIDAIIKTAQMLGYVADKIVDPSYPFFVDIEVAKYLNDECTIVWDVVQDDKVLVTRKQLTFGWLLGDKNDPIFRGLIGALSLAK